MFDQASGLVYNEIILRVHGTTKPNKIRRTRGAKDAVRTNPKHLDWLYICRGSSLTDGRTTRGPPSLELIAARTLLRNLDKVEDGALHGLPLVLAEKVWTWIKQS